MSNNINDSTLIESETNIFRQNIDILKSMREDLWNSDSNGDLTFLALDLDGVYEVLEDLTRLRRYTPESIYEEFVREYDLTMILLQKCLIKSVNSAFLPINEDERLHLKELISKIEDSQYNNKNREILISSLRVEAAKKTLENYGLPKEKIEKMLASGYAVESVLDIEYVTKTKK